VGLSMLALEAVVLVGVVRVEDGRTPGPRHLGEAALVSNHGQQVLVLRDQTHSLSLASDASSMALSVSSALLKSRISESQRLRVKSSRTTTRMSFIFSACGAMV
jgi:hypothetical protein